MEENIQMRIILFYQQLATYCCIMCCLWLKTAMLAGFCKYLVSAV